MSTLNGTVMFAEYEKYDTFNWTDTQTGTIKPLHSFKVLLPHGDGTVTRESISLPPNYKVPSLTAGQTYGFPITVRITKSKPDRPSRIQWDARDDLMPFPAPEIG